MNEIEPSGRDPAPATIDRVGLRAVIRHAAELYAAEAEAAEDRLTEDEVLRIAEELGLPAKHVRRALYEMPARSGEPSLADRVCGPAAATSVRIVSTDPGRTLRRLEDYFTTREYFQVRRRRSDRIALGPADDFISRTARRLRRPEGRFRMAHAGRIVVAARPVDADRTHVRIDVHHDRRRRRMLVGGTTVGVLGGGLLGAGAAFMVDGLLPGLAGTALEVAAYGGGLATGVAAGLGVVAARFRRWIGGSRVEVAGLLDRLEQGEELDPPSAPWLRRIRRRIGLGPSAPSS